jgi:hypothetical protein
LLRDLEKEMEETHVDEGLNRRADEAKNRSRQLANKLEAEQDNIAQKK